MKVLTSNLIIVIILFVAISYLALWYSWLARRPVTAEVVGSSPIRVAGAALKAALALKNWGLSSAGRASALQAEGHRFEPYRSH